MLRCVENKMVSCNCNAIILVSRLTLSVFLTIDREGSDSSVSAIATGSHIDAIPFSGKYDGVVGVLGAIEAIKALNRWLLFSSCIFVYAMESSI